MFEITVHGGTPAAGPGACGVPDLREVPEHHAGIMALGLVPVITPVRRDRADLDEQVPLPGDSGGQSPGAVPPGRAGLAGGAEGEPGPAGRVRPAGRTGFGPCPAAGGRGPGAAVPDSVALAVGDRDAPGRPGVAGGGRGQVAGQVGVDGANPANFGGLATSGFAEMSISAVRISMRRLAYSLTVWSGGPGFLGDPPGSLSRYSGRNPPCRFGPRIGLQRRGPGANRTRSVWVGCPIRCFRVTHDRKSVCALLCYVRLGSLSEECPR
jgi:hypothetical protein